MKYIFGYPLAFIRAIIIFGSMIICMFLYGIVTLFMKHNDTKAFWLRRTWLRFIAIPVLNIKIEKRGNPIEDAALYISNHRSFADPIVICRYLDAFVIAKAEVADYPIINKGAELTGIVYVKREDKNSRSSTREKMIELITNHKNVLVYPEGTVGTDATTLPFKTGTFHEAASHGFSVVPIAIEYRDPCDMWTVPNFIAQYFHQFSKWRTSVKLRFGPNIKNSDPEKLVQESNNWINENLKDMQKGWSKVF